LIFLFSYAIRNLFSEIAKKEKFTYQEFINQTLDEINNFFNRNIVNREEIPRRVKGFHYIFLEGKKTIIPALDFRITKSLPKISALRGTVGNRGRIQGRVRVIKSKKELEELKRGEILVIDIVGPDYVKYLHGVSGIITNAGSILSHAVLVAREFKIPCIVGTKNATEVLKTGNAIDLDADTGKIKIIRKL
jgi:phosphohistidine swiveling domain-containing protein